MTMFQDCFLNHPERKTLTRHGWLNFQSVRLIILQQTQQHCSTDQSHSSSLWSQDQINQKKFILWLYEHPVVIFRYGDDPSSEKSLRTVPTTTKWPLMTFLFKLNHMTYMHRFTADNLETPYFTLPLSSPAEVNRMIGSRNFYLRVYFFQHHQHEDREGGRDSRDQRSSQGGWNWLGTNFNNQLQFRFDLFINWLKPIQ